jgi:mannose-6-phosphate isomerase-like protein (cupin superfamily)
MMYPARRRWIRLALCALLSFAGSGAVSGQSASQKVFYFPKPIAPAPYRAPMKPHVRIAAVEARHKGHANWSETLVADDYNHIQVISAAPGSKVAMHLHADSPEYWFIEQGEIRFEIDDPPGRPHTIDAKPGWLVFCPERMLHSLEVVGSQPAIRIQVTLAEASAIYAEKPAQAPPGTHYIRATVWTYPNPDEVPNPRGEPDRLSFDLDRMLALHAPNREWSDLVIKRNRAHANIICAAAQDVKPKPGDRGHFHDFPETWIIMRGQYRYTIEGLPSFLASQGDLVYAPSTRWHRMLPVGEGTACRLAMTPFPDGNHLYDPPPGAASGQ